MGDLSEISLCINVWTSVCPWVCSYAYAAVSHSMWEKTDKFSFEVYRKIRQCFRLKHNPISMIQNQSRTAVG